MERLASLADSDDLLTIILVRLPARSIFRFRCVSKRWNGIISSPFFIRNYNYRVKTRESCPMVLGLIQNTRYFGPASSSKILSVIVPVPPANEHKIDTSAKLGLKILNSSNGLILCLHEDQEEEEKECTFSILNPFTHRKISLPKSPSLYSSSAVSLICEENPQALNAKYKVFAIEEIKSNYVTMLTFSSDTGKWKTSTLTFTSPVLCGLNNLNWTSPFTANAFIYYWHAGMPWNTNDKCIAVYDTKHDTCIMQLIEPPSRYTPIDGTIDVGRSSGDNALWLCGQELTFNLKVWMLPKGEYDSYKRSSTTIPRTKWILMHSISYEPLFKTILSSQKNEEKKRLAQILGEWIMLETPLVVLLPCRGRYYICNIENNTFEEVEYNKISPGTINYHCISPYLEPLCLSSYAL